VEEARVWFTSTTGAFSLQEDRRFASELDEGWSLLRLNALSAKQRQQMPVSDSPTIRAVRLSSSMVGTLETDGPRFANAIVSDALGSKLYE